jgi:hypothetical protein
MYEAFISGFLLGAMHEEQMIYEGLLARHPVISCCFNLLLPLLLLLLQPSATLRHV